MTANEAVAVKFSGGRDSSLVASLYCLQTRQVTLLRFLTGFGIPSPLPDLRVSELKERFGELVEDRPPIPVYGLVRRIAVADIETDFRMFGGYNLVLLGEGLALHARSLAECFVLGVDSLADGTTHYQRDMPEQRPVAIDRFRTMAEQFGVAYETPLDGYTSADEVKYSLLDLGLSTKSLEGISMFSDSFSTAPDDVITAYLDQKMPIAMEFIDRIVGKRAGP